MKLNYVGQTVQDWSREGIPLISRATETQVPVAALGSDTRRTEW